MIIIYMSHQVNYFSIMPEDIKKGIPRSVFIPFKHGIIHPPLQIY